MQIFSDILLFPCLDGIPSVSYDVFQVGECREYQLIYAQEAMLRRVIHLSERSSTVQVSDKVQHSVAHFCQVLWFSLFSQADLIQQEDRMSKTSRADRNVDFFNDFVMKHDVCIFSTLDAVHKVVEY